MVQGLVVLLIVGAIAGWLAGYIASRNTRLDIMDIVLGIIGAYVGNWLASLVLGVTFGALDPRGIAMSVVGALLVAWIYKKATGNSATS
jgi:uncharacterized membrane protein YeaQ/YmgE (transglycosylase-associated protein family)